MQTFLLAFLHFVSIYYHKMPIEERYLLPIAIYQGVHRDFKVACTFTAISLCESGMKCRKWFPNVKQNMDCCGTHNETLCLELWREHLITDSKHYRKSRQWKLWRKLFQKRPDIGTMVAAEAFSRLADKHGLEKAIQLWKTGRTGTVPGILYAMQVDTLRDGMMKHRR